MSRVGAAQQRAPATADMTGAGPSPGNLVYLVNLFKRPAVPVPGVASWFPLRGIPPL
jgi:hypothetical protein